METLANQVWNDAHRPRSLTSRSPRAKRLRRALSMARRFTLDASMSAFVADLATVPFRAAEARQDHVLDVMRRGARLPHPVTWIELDARAFRRRLIELGGSGADGVPLAAADEIAPRFGYLLEAHRQRDDVVEVTEFCALGDDLDTMQITPVPFRWAWSTDDVTLPYPDVDLMGGSFAHGVGPGLNVSPYVGIVYDDRERLEVTRVTLPDRSVDVPTIVVELSGAVRYLLALLSTLNDVPVTITDVPSAGRFYARGAYHRYLSHQTVTLAVPARVSRERLARKLIVAARRRAHEVRGHWRVYQRGASLCRGPHVWGPADANGHAPCDACSAWRTWIAPHVRGDATIGFVNHDYTVTDGRGM